MQFLSHSVVISYSVLYSNFLSQKCCLCISVYLDYFLETFQLRTNGIVLCELSKIEGLFLPVVEATQPNQVPMPLTAFYLHNLPLDTPASLHNVCW